MATSGFDRCLACSVGSLVPIPTCDHCGERVFTPTTAAVPDRASVPASLVEAMRAFAAAHRRAADAELAPRASFDASRDAELARDALLAAAVEFVEASVPAPCVCGHAKAEHWPGADKVCCHTVAVGEAAAAFDCDCPGYRAQEGGG